MSPGSTTPRSRILYLLVVVHLGWTAAFVAPGYLSVDEGTYHLMVKNFAERGDLEIWNGVRETPSPELRLGSTRIYNGRLVAMTPPFFSALAAPFYLIAGWKGVFWLNALAFVAVLVATRSIAAALFGDQVGVDAALVLALASFLWPYSQAGWPHAVTLALVALAFRASLAAALDDARPQLQALTAGALIAIGSGVRVDAIFLLPAVIAPLLLLAPAKPRLVAPLLAGMVPFLLILAEANRRKFGVFSPFSYGGDATGAVAARSYLLPAFLLFAAGALTAAAVWLRSRGTKPRTALLLGALLVAVLVAVPATRAPIWRLLSGTWVLAVDLRALGERVEPGLVRSENGAMVYAGTLKKALLQSVPYLPICLLPVALAVRERKGLRHYLLMLAAPAPVLAAYGWFRWHGGFSFNLRYWLPVLPFVAILAAAGLGELRAVARVTSAVWARLVAGGAGAAALLYLVTLGVGDSGAALTETLILSLPLAMAAIVMLGVALVTAWPDFSAGPRIAAVATAAALAWATCVAFLYDYRAERGIREFNLRTGQAVASFVEEDSLFLVANPDPFFPLVETPGVRLASPPLDNFADFPNLLRSQEGAGKPIYGAFSPALWRDIESQGLLEGWHREPLGASPRLEIARIVRPPAGSG